MSCNDENCLVDSGESSRFPVSIFIENQLPRWAAEDHPNFIAFLEAYYEWLELADNAYAAKYCMGNNLDVDTTVDQFLEFFKREYLYNIPKELYEKSGCEEIEFESQEDLFQYRFNLPINENSEIKVYVDNVLVDSNLYSIRPECGDSSEILFDNAEFDSIFAQDPAPVIKIEVCEDVKVNTRLLIKTIKEFNASKGTPKSFKLFFKLLFNEDICIENPKELLLKSSDGKWIKSSPTAVYREPSFVATQANIAKFSITRPESDIQTVELNGTPITGYTVESGVLTVTDPVVDGDTIDVYYKLPNTKNYYDFWFCDLPIQSSVVDPVFLGYGATPEIPDDLILRITTNSGVPLNFTPTPNQSDIIIKRHRIVSFTPTVIIQTEDVPRTMYTVIEDTVEYGGQNRIATAIKINPAYSLVQATDGIEIKIQTGLSSVVTETVPADIFVADIKTQLKYGLGVFFNPDIAKPVVKINTFEVNKDTLAFSKKNVSGSTLNISGILPVPLDSLGEWQFGVLKNNVLLQNTVDFVVDIANSEIDFTIPLVPSDVIDVFVSPAYTIIEDDIGGIPNMFVVFDSASGLTIGDAFTVKYEVKTPQGSFKNNDGKISSTMVLQDGFKYQEFSYIIQSNHSIDEYGDYLKNLLHPAGMIMFGKIRLNQCISWLINDYKYYTSIANVDYFPLSGESPALGPTWRSFEINKFDYGLSKLGQQNTPCDIFADEIIANVIDNPNSKIDLLMDSYICIEEIVIPPPVVEYPPLFIGGDFSGGAEPPVVEYPPLFIGGNF